MNLLQFKYNSDLFTTCTHYYYANHQQQAVPRLHYNLFVDVQPSHVRNVINFPAKCVPLAIFLQNIHVDDDPTLSECCASVSDAGTAFRQRLSNLTPQSSECDPDSQHTQHQDDAVSPADDPCGSRLYRRC